jgi:hypothetical protein
MAVCIAQRQVQRHLRERRGNNHGRDKRAKGVKGRDRGKRWGGARPWEEGGACCTCFANEERMSPANAAGAGFRVAVPSSMSHTATRMVWGERRRARHLVDDDGVVHLGLADNALLW